MSRPSGMIGRAVSILSYRSSLIVFCSPAARARRVFPDPAGPIIVRSLTSSSSRRSSAIFCCRFLAITPCTGLRGPVTGITCPVSARSRARPVCDWSPSSTSITNWFGRTTGFSITVPSGVVAACISSRLACTCRSS